MINIPLPPPQLRFMGEDDEKFLAIGKHYIDISLSFGKRKFIIDLGCGYGRMAYALYLSGWQGSYLGMDILKNHITWLQQNFTKIQPRFQFQHLDIRNSRYNPNGILSAGDLIFPPHIKPDLVLLFSVFTHMYEEEIEIYLVKLLKIIPNDGLIVASFFTLPPMVQNPAYEFSYRRNEHCAYYNSADPLHAIAYDREWLFSLVKKVGFICKDFRPGYQDLLILGKV